MKKQIAGFDLGTMNIVSSILKEDNKIEINSMRNMYIEIDTNVISTNEIENTGLDYIIQDDDGEKRIYIIGEDSFKFSQIFGHIPKRPMQNGIMSASEIDSIDVLTLMTANILPKSEDGYCVYSVPAQPIDVEKPPIMYHERVFSRVLKKLGYKSKALNESMAIIFSECEKERFSGIGISFGCGLTNIACAYRGVSTLKFSIGMGGDWIDKCVADSTATSLTRVTNLKEKKLDLMDTTFSKADKKSEKRVLEALHYYYQDLINYVLKYFDSYFKANCNVLNIDEPIPIIVSGGTSLPNGFVEFFKDILDSYTDFPYEISEIRRAVDPLSAVAQGALIYALWEEKQNIKTEIPEAIPVETVIETITPVETTVDVG